MKLMMRVHLIYYLCLFAFLILIPNTALDADIFKLIILFLTIGAFIFLCTFYVILSFNKKIKAIKKYYNLNVFLMFCGTFVLLTFGHKIYEITNSMFIIYGISILLFIASNLLNLKIKKVIENLQFDFWEEAKLFYKMGQAIEKTPLWNASNKLDYLLYAFAATIVLINESIYIFSGIVGIILILSTKYLYLIKTEFLKSGLISLKETYFSLISYYFCYLFSIIWAMFFPNLSILLVGGTGLLAIKIYIRRIAEKVYEERNSYS